MCWIRLSSYAAIYFESTSESVVLQVLQPERRLTVTLTRDLTVNARPPAARAPPGPGPTVTGGPGPARRRVSRCNSAAARLVFKLIEFRTLSSAEVA